MVFMLPSAERLPSHAMAVLDVRRHAERTDVRNDQSSLSAAGRAMAEALAKRADAYALVLSSPLPRAKETAQLIARRLDGIDPGLLPEMGGAIGDRIFGELRTLGDWAAVLREREEARTFATEQLGTWARIAARAGEKERVLAVSHGGIIGLPAPAPAQRLPVRPGRPGFGYGGGAPGALSQGPPAPV